MKKKTLARCPPFQPLADGQVWRMPEAILQVTMVGKLLVHYKLGKPNAIRECLLAVMPAIPYCIELIEGPLFTTNEGVVKTFRPKS